MAARFDVHCFLPLGSWKKYMTHVSQSSDKNQTFKMSENGVPLNPMVLLIIIPTKWLAIIGNINPTFSDKPILFNINSNINANISHESLVLVVSTSFDKLPGLVNVNKKRWKITIFIGKNHYFYGHFP